MTHNRIAAVVTSIALGSAALLIPGGTGVASAQAGATTPPPGTTDTCDASVSTTNFLDAPPAKNDAGQAGANIPSALSIGIQKYANNDSFVNWRPWVKVVGWGKRKMVNTTATFTQNAAIEGESTITPKENGNFFTVPVTD
ncbi:MAG TPA: hypothetical protein H9867_06120 [Candidatus Corynebacterium gallistercoris]|uniref:Secreted protein n=1 Tax=Candidatus Corynebacterium gallistercoris TaxID=2838530 RepID=A0A9D1S0I1_9CORY|nr:hypothetical protein [Candidatus Corynebacterium gallistercoris]